MSQDKDQLHALLADYVEGSLSEQQIEEAEAFLAANPGVRSVVDKLMIDSEALRALPPVRSPVDYSEEIRGAAERDLLLSDAPEARTRRPLSGPTAALAALLFVTLGLGGAAYYILTNRPPTSFDFASTAVRNDAAATSPAAEALRAEEATPPLELAARAKEKDSIADATPATPAAAAAPVSDGERASQPLAAPAAARPDAAALELKPAAPVAVGGRATRAAGEILAARRARDLDTAGAVGGFGGGGGAVGGAWPRELEVPAAVQAVVDAAPVEGGRTALAVVVNDVAAVDAMRKLVRDNVGLEQQAQNVYEKVSNAKVLAATLPVDLGPLVATDVPVELAKRIRTAVAAERAATVYDVTPTRAAFDERAQAVAESRADVQHEQVAAQQGAAPTEQNAGAAQPGADAGQQKTEAGQQSAGGVRPNQQAAAQQNQMRQEISGVNAANNAQVGINAQTVNEAPAATNAQAATNAEAASNAQAAVNAPAAKAVATSRPANVDVFVIVVPSPAPATLPAE